MGQVRPQGRAVLHDPAQGGVDQPRQMGGFVPGAGQRDRVIHHPVPGLLPTGISRPSPCAGCSLPAATASGADSAPATGRPGPSTLRFPAPAAWHGPCHRGKAPTAAPWWRHPTPPAGACRADTPFSSARAACRAMRPVCGICSGPVMVDVPAWGGLYRPCARRKQETRHDQDRYIRGRPERGVAPRR